ncbi:HlyD family secretion protein [Consotaella salsifontis]|uniref:Membrane fusion protein, multidrug efflux system n=1 Tax=Consotaella salsifontis TaxID=1365950 RepID=A0A1T4T741_9HYPH|nr:HlyD family secretion protein [Consotaella salsifontis]SKA36304.1 membrane fusion protein, multidrug efflux system [Consotaella salsifontis]
MLDDVPTAEKAATETRVADDRAPKGDMPKAEAGQTSVAPQPGTGAGAAPAAKPKRGKGKLILAIVALAAIGGGSYFGHYWWTEGRFMISTDDAYLSADMTVLSPKISGYIKNVLVEDNEFVREGQTIFEIDPGDFHLAVDSAAAKIATQRAAVERIHSQRDAAREQVAQAQANVEVAEATLQQAELTLGRAKNLLSTKVGSRATLDEAQSARDKAAANLVGMKAAVAAAKANISVLDAQATEAETEIGELEVALKSAQRDLSFTTITAPYDGVIGNLAVQPGDLVAAGRKMAALVPLEDVFISANFKETEMADIVAGEKVNITIDALPDHTFSGSVASISPASGSVFSLLPADNATGNFTKIVQRVPVRIHIDQVAELQKALRPGLSAVVAIDTRTAPEPGQAVADAGR